MTWNELKTFISKMDTDYLDKQVFIYDFSNGDEHPVDITELMINGWTPYLSINNEELNDETKTKETSIS
jgi:hypothetical protein